MLDKIRNSFPWLELLCVDSGYNAHQVDAAVAKVPALRIQIVKRSDDIKGFVLRPPRWVVKKAFSWVGRIRRLAKGWENLAAPRVSSQRTNYSGDWARLRPRVRIG